MLPYLYLLRPYSWIKNFFVFVPIFFAHELFSVIKLIPVLYTFLIFCLTASSVYIINDIADRERDKNHSSKKHRPLPSGKVSLREAGIMLILLIITSAFLIYYLVPEIAPLIFTYFVLNLFYSLYLKHIAIVDILLVSSFYLLRIEAGGQAAQVPISAWLILCTIFLALFLIVGKRKAEIVSLDSKREVLSVYTHNFLEALLIISVTSSIISYSLYTVLVLNSPHAVYSIFFVLLGVFRYMFLTYTTNQGEYPEKAIWDDKIVLLSILGWVVFMYYIFYS